MTTIAIVFVWGLIGFSQSLLTLDLIEEYLCQSRLHTANGESTEWRKNRNYFRESSFTHSHNSPLAYVDCIVNAWMMSGCDRIRWQHVGE